MANKKNLPFCPLTSIGTGIDMVCTGERCAWFMPGVKKCAMYVMAYSAILDANQRQQENKKD